MVPNTGSVGQVHYTLGLAVETLGHLLVALPRFVAGAPVVFAFAAWAVWRGRRDSRTWLLVGMLVAVPVGYLFWWGTANAVELHIERALGPFYYYPMLASVAVLAARGVFEARLRSAVAGGVLAIALLWTAGASFVVARDANRQGIARSSDVASTRGPPNRIVISPPTFENDPYIRFANDADLDGSRVVAIDLPDRHLEVLERFPDRHAFLVRLEHREGEPFARPRRRRIPIELVRGDAVEVRLDARVPAGRGARAYLAIEGRDVRYGAPGRRRVEETWRLTPEAFGREPVTVTAGITIGGPDGRVPGKRTEEFVECLFEARAVDGQVEVVSPCLGRVGYVFLNGAHAALDEDLGDRLAVELMPVR